MIIPTPCLLDEIVTYHSEQATESPLLERIHVKKNERWKKMTGSTSSRNRDRTKSEQKGHCQKLTANKS